MSYLVQCICIELQCHCMQWCWSQLNTVRSTQWHGVCLVPIPPLVLSHVPACVRSSWGFLLTTLCAAKEWWLTHVSQIFLLHLICSFWLVSQLLTESVSAIPIKGVDVLCYNTTHGLNRQLVYVVKIFRVNYFGDKLWLLCWGSTENPSSLWKMVWSVASCNLSPLVEGDPFHHVVLSFYFF